MPARSGADEQLRNPSVAVTGPATVLSPPAVHRAQLEGVLRPGHQARHRDAPLVGGAVPHASLPSATSVHAVPISTVEPAACRYW